MSVDLDRWERDRAAPRPADAIRDFALRVFAPMLVLFAAIVGVGFAVVRGLDDLKGEDEINRELQEGRSRTPLWDNVTSVWSHIGNTEYVIGVCVIAVAVIWWRTRRWWYAVIPAIAISMQATVFVIAAAIVGRQRPEAERMDTAPPTSSYPSGHVGAATALYLTFAFMAQRIESAWVRRLVTAVCLTIPFLVAYARLYRGMHQAVDVVVGLLNGVVCALLAWYWLRRRSTSS